MAIMNDCNPFRPRRTVPHRSCGDCPYYTGSVDRRMRHMIGGKTFDLRNVDGVIDALAVVLRACGAGAVVVGAAEE